MFGSPLAASALTPLALLLSLAAPPADESAPGDDDVPLPIDASGTMEAFAGPRVLAAEAFESGRQAFDEGDYEAAIEHFERAQSFVPHPDTQYNLGVAMARAGRHLEAWTLFDELSREAKDSQIRQDARERLREAEAKISLLRLRLHRDASACVDGRAIEHDARDHDTLPLEPGEHEIIVNHRSVTLELFPGELRVVHIEAEPAPTITPRTTKLTLLGIGAGGSAVAAGLGVSSALSAQRSTQRGLAWGAATAGAVGLIGSGTALLLHMRERKAEAGGLPPRRDPCSLRPLEGLEATGDRDGGGV